MSSLPAPWLQSWISVGCANWLEATCNQLTDHSLYYSILTDSPLLDSARAVFKIFRRNLVTSLATDTTSNVLLVGYLNIATALICTIAALVSKSPRVAVACGFASWNAVHFFTTIITACIESTLVCYAVDLDCAQVHNPSVHQAFAGRLAIIRDSHKRNSFK